MSNESTLIAAEKYSINLQAQLAVLMKQIATRDGFLQYYYNILPNCSTQISAFNIVSLLYFLVFDEQMFSSYESFKKFKNRKLKK